jgi:SAM-dependent methyltransferase
MSRSPAILTALLAVLPLAAPAGRSSPTQAPLEPSPLQLAPPPLLQPPLALPPPPELPPSPREKPIGPVPGQAGKDVIWLPTPEKLVDRMLAMAQVGPRDVVYDLGSGDGRLVIAAAHLGARAVGVEFNPELVELSGRRARAQGLAGRARFVRADIFATDFSEASVVTLYLLPSLNLRLRPILLAMRPGTRVVSHAFDMDDWTPDEISRAEGRTAYLWIVPAEVKGPWRVDVEGGPAVDVTLTQRFQRIEGRVALGDAEGGLRDASLRGGSIRFDFVDASGTRWELRGTVLGDRISGTATVGGRSRRFTAVRR